jgi:hypothetical protein
MSEFLMFLVDLGLVVGVSAFAVVARGRVSGRLAAGVYALLTGVGLLLLPMQGWEVARTDNAFLGLYLIALLVLILGVVVTVGAVLRLRAEPRSRPVPALLAALVAAALALGLLAVRGPGAWATGSGQFGMDDNAVDVALGLAAYFAGRRLGGAEVRPGSAA